MAGRAVRARKRLAGLGSEGWGVVPQICLVDPFPDPDDPSRLVTDGTIVDAARNEIWMVVSPESPPEDLERPLALLFGASLPAAAELAPLLEGYALWLAKSDPVDDQLAQMQLPPLSAAEGELRAAMGFSFVCFLLEREKEDGLRKVLGTAQPGRLDQALQEQYGLSGAPLEEAWREKLASGGPKVKTGQFLRLSLRYLRPYTWRQAEIFVYMLFALAFTLVFPFVTRRLFDEALPSGEFSQVMTLLGALGVAFLISLFAGLRQAYASAWISGAVVRDLRGQMFGKLQTLSTGWFQRHQQGDVLTRLFTDVAVVEQGLTQTLREGLFQILSLVLSSIVMLTLDLRLGIIVLLGVPLVAVVYRTMAAGAQKRGLAVQQDTGALMGVAAENYSAEPVVKMFALQSRERERFGRLAERLFRSERRLNLYGGLFGLSVNLIVTILRLGVLAYGSWLILNGHFTLGGLVAFLGIMGEVLSPVTMLTSIGQMVQAATGALFRINEVLDAQPELDDAELVDEDGAPLPALPPLGREITISGVGFSYTAERQVLHGVNAVIPAGVRAAFVGPSGSGKSTVLQLLMRLYDPDEGAIYFDGYDLTTMSAASARGQIGVVFQDNFLFDTTLRENIGFGKVGATDEEIEAAARAAEVHDFISQLPRGYDTVVGERGAMLSGGQRQRVAIARALIRNPRLLLLDEATSALDPKTERQIISTLNSISQGRTTVAITHRLTSVTDYDVIFVIVAGEIIETGTHDQLLANQGTYARLWAEQTGHALAVETMTFDPAAALASLPIFAALGPDDLEQVASRLVSLDLQPGEAIADSTGHLSIVARGRARALAPSLNGTLVPTALLEAGDAFGLNALLSGPNGSRLEAVDAVTLLVLSDEVLRGIVATMPSVADALAGATTPSVAPEGGERLSRMTMSVRASDLAAVIAGAAGTLSGGPGSAPLALGNAGTPQALAEDGRRLTGTFPTTGNGGPT
jgi:ATP-binding cassette subfamily B protein